MNLSLDTTLELKNTADTVLELKNAVLAELGSAGWQLGCSDDRHDVPIDYTCLDLLLSASFLTSRWESDALHRVSVCVQQLA